MGNLTQALVGATNYTVVSSDTKNTAGSTDTSSKIFLIGATSQAANPQTYSHDTAYVGTDGCLYSGGNKVLTSAPVTSVVGKTGAVTLTASDVGALASSTKYAGASTAGGSATSAAKLDTTTAGSTTQPCYFSNGVPSACTYSLNKTVPSDAVFTDTKVYYCTCEDAVTVSAKTASCSDTSFTLTAGVMVIVNFQHGYNLFNTLNINNTGAKNFKYQGKSSFYGATNITGDISIPMVYDGTYWVIISSVDNYYMPNSVMTSSNSNYTFLMSASSGTTDYSPINTTGALSFNINEGKLTVKNNQANDPYMYYLNNDIVANGTTWDGTNTSLKTAVSSKVNKAGDSMTGALTFNKVSNAIHYTGSKADYTMIQFIDNTSDTYGNGIAIGGGGQAIIGGGESSTVMKDNAGTAGAEEMWIGNDGDVHIYTNLQNGWANRNDFQFTAGKNIFLPSGGGLYFPNDGIINFQSSTTSEATGDICWSYSNTKEKARIWCDGSFTSGAGPSYRCYNSSGTQLYAGRLQVTGTSDIRLKENVKDTNINNALDIINQIKMRQFDWKNTDEHQDIGFIADELEEFDKNFVDKGTGGLDKFGEINPKSVNTFYLLGYVVKALQELSAENKNLKEQIEVLWKWV